MEQFLGTSLEPQEIEELVIRLHDASAELRMLALSNLGSVPFNSLHLKGRVAIILTLKDK